MKPTSPAFSLYKEKQTAHRRFYPQKKHRNMTIKKPSTTLMAWCWAFSDYSDFQRVKQCAVFTTPDFSTAFLLPHSQFTQQLNQNVAAHLDRLDLLRRAGMILMFSLLHCVRRFVHIQSDHTLDLAGFHLHSDLNRQWICFP